MTSLESLIRELVRDELSRISPSADPTLLTVAAYAARSSISERTVRDAIRDGRLDHVRIGRAVRVPSGAKIEARSDRAAKRARLRLMGEG